MIPLLAPILLALAVGSDEEDDTSLEKALGIWKGPIFDDDDLERLMDEGWIFSGYLVSVYSTTTTWTDPEAGEYEHEHDTIAHDEPVETLHDACEFRQENWSEWSGDPPQEGCWLCSDNEPDFRTGDDTQYELFITRQDGEPLSEAEFDYIDCQIEPYGWKKRHETYLAKTKATP